VWAGRRCGSGRWCASPARVTRRDGRYAVGVLETIFLVLLTATFGFIAWFAVYTVYKLYQGQR
jgi:hypothetical protein